VRRLSTDCSDVVVLYSKHLDYLVSRREANGEAALIELDQGVGLLVLPHFDHGHGKVVQDPVLSERVCVCLCVVCEWACVTAYCSVCEGNGAARACVQS